MPKTYWVVSYHSVNNPDALQAYAKLAGPAIDAAGGRFIVRGKPVKIMEAGINERTVVVEFDSLDKALGTYDSPGYQEALKVLGSNNVKRDMRILEGA